MHQPLQSRVLSRQSYGSCRWCCCNHNQPTKPFTGRASLYSALEARQRRQQQQQLPSRLICRAQHSTNGATGNGREALEQQLTAYDLAPYKGPKLQQPKCFVFVRHGHSTWNHQSRIQGNTNESELTEIGRAQAVRAREALQSMRFDSCFSSPHTRARQTAEIVWEPWSNQNGSSEPQYLKNLSECDLGWFQGLRNEDIAREHPDLYRVWREEPENFMLEGRLPVLDAFRQAKRAWTDMLSTPGSSHLVITHKSLLRALLCTALGLPPRQFRAIDIANGAICMVRCNLKGDMMLSALNLTSHLVYNNVKYQLPVTNANDQLAATKPAKPASVYSTALAGSNSSSSSGGSSGSSNTWDLQSYTQS